LFQTPGWYSRLLYSNQLPTSIFIEIPVDINEQYMYSPVWSHYCKVKFGISTYLFLEGWGPGFTRKHCGRKIARMSRVMLSMYMFNFSCVSQFSPATVFLTISDWNIFVCGNNVAKLGNIQKTRFCSHWQCLHYKVS